MYNSTNEYPDSISGTDLRDPKTKAYYQKLLGDLTAPIIHQHLDLQCHFTKSTLQCGLYEENSRLVLYIPENKRFTLSEIVNHLQHMLHDQLPYLMQKVDSNNCISQSDLECARKYINHKI